MLMRVADWHGIQAANAYNDWNDSNKDEDLNRYLRHTRIAEFLWKNYKNEE